MGVSVSVAAMVRGAHSFLSTGQPEAEKQTTICEAHKHFIRYISHFIRIFDCFESIERTELIAIRRHFSQEAAHLRKILLHFLMNITEL